MPKNVLNILASPQMSDVILAFDGSRGAMGWLSALLMEIIKE
jgi:hypothetical protein